jgi:hypothetical protein
MKLAAVPVPAVSEQVMYGTSRPGPPIAITIAIGGTAFRAHWLHGPLAHLSAVSAPDSVTASWQIAMQTIISSGAIAHWSLMAQMWTLSHSLTRAFLSAHELMTWKAGNS